jgi:hypothetical protein
MTSPDGVWMPNESDVIAKVIDGEAIIIRVSDGVYYSMDKIGGFLWDQIARHSSADQLAESLVARYEVSLDQARADVASLLAQLVEERLVAVSRQGPAPGSVPPAADEKQPYARPVLNIYRDMGDLLALDPPAPGMTDIAWKSPDTRPAN